MLINDVSKFALNTAAVPLPVNAGDAIVQAPFNTQILRVTDDASFPSGSGIYEYGGIYDTWNADSTAFLSLGPVLWSFDPAAFKVTGHRVPWWPSSYTKIYWSRRDPNVMFFIAPDGIYRWDIRQPAGAKVLDYKATDPAWVIGPGVDSRGMSGDDDRFMLSRWGDGDPAINGRLCVVSISQQKILFKLDVPTDVAGDPARQNSYEKMKGSFDRSGRWLCSFQTLFDVDNPGKSFRMDVYGGSYLDVHADFGTGCWACGTMHTNDRPYQNGYRLMPNRQPAGQVWQGPPQVPLTQAIATGNDAASHTSYRKGTEDEYVVSTFIEQAVPAGVLAPGRLEVVAYDQAGNHMRIAHHYASGDVYERQPHAAQSQCGSFVAWQSDSLTKKNTHLFVAKIRDYIRPTLPTTPKPWPLPPAIATKIRDAERATEGGFGPLGPITSPKWFVQVWSDDLNPFFSRSPDVGSIAQNGVYTPPIPLPVTPVPVTITVTGLDGQTASVPPFQVGSGVAVPPPPPPPPPTLFKLTVTNGTGSGSYTAGATVTITANPPNAGQSFNSWTGPVKDGSAASTSLVMPAADTVVTANYQAVVVAGGIPGPAGPAGKDGRDGKDGKDGAAPFSDDDVTVLKWVIGVARALRSQ